MTYRKPEITVMGEASEVIQIVVKDNATSEGGGLDNSPAYDLDE